MRYRRERERIDKKERKTDRYIDRQIDMINDKFNPYVYIVACVYIEYVWLPKGKSPDPLGIPFAPICHYLATSCLTDSNEGLPSSKRRGSSTPVAEAI